MGLIPNDTINQVIERSDIAAIIGNYTALKKAGRNFKALCPFHHEKTPSFVVNPDKQIFHCFGCGVGGNVIGFIQRQEHMEFPEAVRFLAGKAGITIPDDEKAQANPSRQLRDDIHKVNALAAGFFHEVLLTSREADAKAARDYLKNRGIGLETVKKFQLGFAPNEWDALLKHLKTKGISEELMAQAGLVIPREGKSGFYDRFRNRVVFPIADVQGRAVAFGARALPVRQAGMSESEGAKYINSPETAVYTKGRHLFGLDLTKNAVAKLDRVIVVEGYMDMIMPFVHGVENIAASLGTALTVEQIRLIRRYTNNVVMLFDADAAGQAAIVRSLDLLAEEDMNVRVAALSQGEDPDSFIRKQGTESFAKRLAEAQTILDFKFNWLCRQHDLATVEGKSTIARELLGTIARFNTEVARYELTRELARKLEVPEGVLLKQAGYAGRPHAPVPSPEIKTSPSAFEAQELLLALFLKDPAWVKAAWDHGINPPDFSDGNVRSIMEKIWTLTMTSMEWSTNDLLMSMPDEATQSLVTKFINVEEKKLTEPSLIFKDCIAKIQLKKIEEAIRQANASNDMEKANELRKQRELLKTSR